MIYSTFLRCLLVAGLALFSANALIAQGSSAKTTKVRVGNCDYQVISGLAEVTRVEKRLPKDSSALQYDEHAIFFKFIPKEGGELIGSLRDQELEFFLSSDGEKFPVGPQYMKQYQIRPNTKYAMKFLQGPACEEKYRFGETGGLPNDISEASARLEELKRIRREEEFRIQDSLRTAGDTTAATSVPAAMTKEEKKRYDDSLALEKKRVDDSIAEYKRNYAFIEQESRRAKADSAYIADSIRNANAMASNPTITPPVITPTKKDTPAVKVEEPAIEIDSAKIKAAMDIDKERIKREVEERLRKEQEEKDRRDSLAQDKQRKELDAQRLKDSLEQDKIRRKNYKKFQKDSIKLAKIEAERVQDSIAQAKIRQEREERRLLDSINAERARIEKAIEDEVRRNLEIEKARTDSIKAADEARRLEEERQAAERARIEAERQAAEKKRKDDEIKRGDCVYKPKISGIIHIVEVKKIKEAEESYVGYAEYEVRYKFTPSNMNDIPKKEQKIWETEYTLVIDPKGKSANPSAAYITTYNVFKNARFNGFAEVLSEGICNTVTVFSPQLPVDAGKLDLK